MTNPVITNRRLRLCFLFRILIIPVLSLLLPACDESLESLVSEKTPLTIEISLPEEIGNIKVISESFTFSDISSATEISFQDKNDIRLTPGYYTLIYSAEAEEPSGRSILLRGVTTSIAVGSEPLTVKVEAFGIRDNDDLVIAEIFFAGTLQSSGNQYYGDDYIKLYNNTDHTVYADGITLFESKFLTTEKYDYTPDIMGSAVTVHALYTIPGSGREHPVEPGQYLLIADVGIDHRVSNPNSFSLTHADFEWYDNSTQPGSIDIDSPVPNLDKWYCYTKSFWLLHNRGFKAYGIARIPIERDIYLKNYLYEYDYIIDTMAGTFPMSGTAYRLPDEWVADIVNCSVASEYAWNVCSPELDMGWTHCGTVNNDKSRYFHSVRRKMLYLDASGHPVLKDTDNSTDDFNADCIPSEIEEQETVMSIDGTKCTQKTYDGIIPRK